MDEKGIARLRRLCSSSIGIVMGLGRGGHVSLEAVTVLVESKNKNEVKDTCAVLSKTFERVGRSAKEVRA